MKLEVRTAAEAWRVVRPQDPVLVPAVIRITVRIGDRRQTTTLVVGADGRISEGYGSV